MIAELLKSVRYIVDPQGHPSAAVGDIEAWQRMLAWLLEQEDLVDAREALRELQAADNDAARGLAQVGRARARPGCVATASTFTPRRGAPSSARRAMSGSGSGARSPS